MNRRLTTRCSEQRLAVAFCSSRALRCQPLSLSLSPLGSSLTSKGGGAVRWKAVRSLLA